MLQQFVSVALPIVMAVAIAAWLQNGRFTDLREDMNNGFGQIGKRLDRMDDRLDRVDDRLGRIEMTLREHGERLARVEERLSPFTLR